MPAEDAGLPAARHAMRLHYSVPSPDRVDAAAHAATIRGIGAALAERARACSRRGAATRIGVR